jgi:hypothetical protein
MIRHQKNTKYCISIQEKLKSQEKVVEKQELVTECKLCSKNFSCAWNLKRHNCSVKKIIAENTKNNLIIIEQSLLVKQLSKQLKSLKKQLSKQLKEKDRQIEKLQNTINKIAMKPKTINNIAQVVNLQSVSQSSLDNHSENFTLEHFKRGLDGVADFSIKFPLNNAISCQDSNRKQFLWRDGDNGDVVMHDKNIYHMAKKIGQSLRHRSEDLLKKAVDEITLVFENKKSNTDDPTMIAFYQTQLVAVKTQYTKCARDISNLELGDINSAVVEFARIMSIKVPRFKESDEIHDSTYEISVTDDEIYNDFDEILD